MRDNSMTSNALISEALQGNDTAVADESQAIPRADDYRALSDRECILLARQGRRSGMGELIHRYTDGIFHLQLRLLGDRELAADVIWQRIRDDAPDHYADLRAKFYAEAGDRAP